MSYKVQEALHRWEVGVGSKIVKGVAAVLAFVALAVWYDLRVFTGLSTSAGMDAAQLARNISQGEGYSTDFIRPFSMHLLAKQTGEQTTNANPLATSEQWKRHPDLANAPAYPVLLAGALKVMLFNYSDLLTAGAAAIYNADYWVTGFNQLLFLIALLLTFYLGRRLFDESVAWLGTMLTAGSSLLWDISASGHGGMLATVLLLAAAAAVLAIENRSQEEQEGQSRVVFWALTAGVLAALLALTRYGLALLIVPIVVCIASTSTPRRGAAAAAAGGAFVILLAPWLVRNYALSGTLFGTASYTFAEGVEFFPGDELGRTLNPDLNRLDLDDVWAKWLTNVEQFAQGHFADFAGSWVSGLFLVGLLVPFRNPTLRRMRGLALGFVGTLFVVQGFYAGAWHDADFAITPGNLLAIAAPLAALFGAGFVSTLAQSLPTQSFRVGVMIVIAGVAWLPLLINLFQRHSVSFYPASVQEKAQLVGQREAIMTDIPAQLAWYGDRPAVWLTPRHRDLANKPLKSDFYAVHAVRPLSGLLLASKGLQSLTTGAVAQWRAGEEQRQGDDWREFLEVAAELMKQTDQNSDESDRLRRLLQLADQHWPYGRDDEWPGFLLGIYVNGEVPTGFPFKRAPTGLWPELFLTNSERNPGE